MASERGPLTTREQETAKGAPKGSSSKSRVRGRVVSRLRRLAHGDGYSGLTRSVADLDNDRHCVARLNATGYLHVNLQ
jgi:hypothetical protein